MTHAVRVSEDLFVKAQVRAQAVHRSIAGPIEYWSQLGRIAEDNQDLPFSMIHDILVGLQEMKNGHVSLYQFG